MTGNREQRRREAREARRAVTTTSDDMHARDNALVDTRGAVLVDSWHTLVVHAGRAGDVVGLEVAGRVNKSTARATALYLVDATGAAKLAADLVSLAARHGATDPAWAETFRQAFDAQLTAGTTPRQEPQP